MNTSDKIDLLAPALVKAQAALPKIRKDSENPHFRSHYLSLEGLLEAVRPALLGNGFAILQSTTDSDDAAMTVTTRLLHTSGQWIEGGVRLPIAKPDPQAAGSAYSYGKRYSLEGILGITGSDDDDGNTAAVHQALQPARNAAGVLTSPDTLGGKHVAIMNGTVTETPPCPKCNKSMWDNRVGKKNPKAPDFKCRDKSCDGVIWPPKDGGRVAVPVGPAFDDLPDGLRDGEDFDPTIPF